MFESDDHYRDIVSGMLIKSVFQQELASRLSIFNVTNEVDGWLVVDNVPELRGKIRLHSTCGQSKHLHHRTPR